MTKKVICFLLAVLTAFSLCVPAGAEPEITAERQGEALYELYVNPLYADILTEADVLSRLPEKPETVASSVSKTVSTKAQAAAYLRQQMAARKGTISFAIADRSLGESGLTAIFESAIEHTGAPAEGDYLRWQVGGWQAGGPATSTGYYITYNVFYYTTAAQEDWVASKVSGVLGGLGLGGKSSYEKVRAIYQYICSHVTYDFAHLNDPNYPLQFTAYAALHDGTAVCQGYSNLLYRMALTAGIDCRIITSADHAWNIVKLGTKYYNLDATWDSEYPESRWKYFLLCDENFEDDWSHVREAPWYYDSFYAQYPMGSTDYAPGSEPAPTAVPQLEAPAVTISKVSGGIQVSWNKIAGSPRYMVYYRENGGEWKKIGTTTATTYTRKAKDLKNGVTYQFTVRCCANDKKTLLGPYTASNSLTYGTQLEAPTVIISKVSGGIRVTWNKISGSPRYMVYYKENGGGWKKIGTTTATTYTRKAKDLKNGVTYQFAVRCVKNDKKTMLSGYTASNSLTYGTQLEAPTVTISKVSGGIRVTWNKVAGSPRYMVYYKENGGGWKKIGTTTATAYTRKAANLKDGVTYTFTVRCCANDKKTMLSGYTASNSLNYKK